MELLRGRTEIDTFSQWMRRKNSNVIPGASKHVTMSVKTEEAKKEEPMNKPFETLSKVCTRNFCIEHSQKLHEIIRVSDTNFF